jgi:class 3 adenylate cyclase/tetratricopeptide (TPR) repeat protein
VTCSTCGTDNGSGRRFCVECGTPLAAVCPGCGAPTEPGGKFCGSCGAPLRAAAPGDAGRTAATQAADEAPTVPAPLAERRLVSVLFADLVGFTTLAEGRDVEDTRDLLSRYFDLATDVIGRYGGSVEKFIGDAVMAVWGAPVAHEDDAERAVRAGLELVDAVRTLGPSITARAGILTGEAAVTLGATSQGMVAGDLVNTASRLQSVAAPGTVLVGEATQRAAARAIAFERAGDHALKGRTATVPAFCALRVIAERGGRNRSDTLEAPFVGRDDELRLLKDLFHATGREQRARLVSVTGPGGIGKTRLAWELQKYIDGLVEDVWWHAGRSPAYGDGISFWALGEMVRERAGLAETDDEPTTRVKIVETLATHVPDPEERRWIEPALLALLGVETGMGSEQLFGAWRMFFERLAATAPVVMVFEDFHYADSGLVTFVDHLLEWSRGVPITVVTLARTDFLDRHADWGAGKRSFTSLHLEPLPEPAMRALLAGLVPGLPEAAVRQIIARADGTPLYAVETVRMLLAEGRLALEGDAYRPIGDLTSLAVPDTLTALIAARLDGLAADDRTLVSDAAVLGQSFTLAGLAAVSGIAEADLVPRLRTLVRRELLALEADPRSPGRGQYAFVGALIREVAYNTLARRDRKVRHLAAARYFESLGSDELAGAVAGHVLAAYRNTPAGPEADALVAQARVTLKAAAERAAALGSHDQAVGFLDQALEVTPDPAERAELLELAGESAIRADLNDVAEDRLRNAVELRRALGDPDALAAATTLLGRALIGGLRAGTALPLLASAVQELLGVVPEPAAPRGAGAEPTGAEPTGGPDLGPGGVALLAQLSRAYFMSEEPRQSIETADRALAASERLDLVPIVCDALITRGSALCSLARPYEGLAAIRAGIDLAEEHGLVPIVVRGRLNLGAILQDSDPRASFETTEAALEIATRLGMRAFARDLVGNAATAAIDVGEWEWAIREVSAARDESLDERARYYLRWVLATFSAWRGEEVLPEVERLAEWVEVLSEPGAMQAVRGLRAEVDFAAGDYPDACDTWLAIAPGDSLNAPRFCFTAGLAALMACDPDRATAALAAHERTGQHGRLPGLDRRLLRAGLAALDGRRLEATREARAVITEYERLGLPWRQALGTLMLALTVGPGEPDVRAMAAPAREILVRLGARPFLERLDIAMTR